MILRKKNSRGLKNQQGLSLIEVLLSIAVFSALVFAGAGWMNLLNKEAGSANENVAIANAMGQVKYAFGDDDRYCTKILGILPNGNKRTFNINNTAGENIPRIDYYDLIPNTPALSKVMVVGETLPEKAVTVQEIRLKPVSVLSPSTVLSNLEIKFLKAARSGPQQITRTMPIYVTISAAGVIQKCSTSLSTSLVTSRVCEVSTNGYQRWNPANEKCELIEGVEWVSGTTPFKATCGAGQVVAVSGMEAEPQQIACRTSSTQGPPIPPRTYLSGFTDVSNTIGWTATLDIPTNTCTFVYVAGSEPTTDVAQIKCANVGEVER